MVFSSIAIRQQSSRPWLLGRANLPQQHRHYGSTGRQSKATPNVNCNIRHNTKLGDFLSTDHEMRLYVPVAYNFNHVDGVILLLNRLSKQVSLFPLQFTLSMKHKRSDEEFYTNLWPTWIELITLAGFTVQSTLSG